MHLEPAAQAMGELFAAAGNAQAVAMRLARTVLAHEIAEALDGPGTALEKLHAVARICEREAR